MPIPSLRDLVTPAYANTITGKDGYVRQSIRSLNYEGETYNSLAYETYARYQESIGAPKYEPKVDEDRLFSFLYTGRPESFDVVSLVDVLEGSFPRPTLPTVWCWWAPMP